jgi:hypothetical protein
MIQHLLCATLLLGSTLDLFASPGVGAPVYDTLALELVHSDGIEAAGSDTDPGELRATGPSVSPAAATAGLITDASEHAMVARDDQGWDGQPDSVTFPSHHGTGSIHYAYETSGAFGGRGLKIGETLTLPGRAPHRV